MDLEALDELAQSIWEDMQASGFSKDSCVAAARIGIDVLAALGYRGKPLPVTFNVVNQEMLALLIADVPQDTIAALQTGVDEDGGPWWVTVGEIVKEGHQGAGHVVIYVPSARALLDIAAPQASRPHKSIIISEPIVVSLDGDMALAPGRIIELASDQGSRGWYEVVAKRTYMDSPNWYRQSSSSTLQPAFTEIVARQVKKFERFKNVEAPKVQGPHIDKAIVDDIIDEMEGEL